MAYAEIKIQMRGVTKVRKIVKKRVRENTLIPTHHQLSAVHGEAFAKIKIQNHGVTKARKIVKDRVMENTLIPINLRLEERAVVHGLGNAANLTIRFAILKKQIVKVHVMENGRSKSKASC